MFCSRTLPLAAAPAAATLAFSLAVITLSGCVPSLNRDDPPASMASPSTMPLVSERQRLVLRPEPSAPVRYGRYTLANTAPRVEQLDLLSQVIDLRMPETLNPTVQEAMTYALRRSGYRLCPGTGSGAEDVQRLYAHPLPASQYHLGPITLHNAMRVLAGAAWRVEVDEKARQICFVARDRVSAHGSGGVASGTLTSPAALPPGGE